jgi:hypothetical protein
MIFAQKKDFGNEKTINTFARTKKAFLFVLKKLNFSKEKIWQLFHTIIKVRWVSG